MENKLNEDISSRGFKGIWIPKDVWLTKDINFQEKLLLAEIDSLDNEKGCIASNKYFSEFFGLSESRISLYISNLKKKGYIVIESFNGRQRIMRSNLRLVKKRLQENKSSDFLKTRRQTTRKQDTYNIDYNKDYNKNIILHSNEDVAGDKINNLIELFKPINPTYERLFSNKTQRSAIERLLKKFEREKLEEIIKTLIHTNQKQYAPTITNPLELENKLAQLVVFIQKEKSKGSKIIEI